MSTLIGISTFKKPSAADQLIETLLKHDYHKTSKIMIADDDNGSAKPVFDKYRKEARLVYTTGTNLGISHNKNRILKYFLSKPHFTELLLLDDDILFTQPGAVDHCRMVCDNDIKLPFVSALWTDFESKDDDSVKQSTGLVWTQQFPVKGGTEWATSHEGKHGCFLYFKREAIEKVGYYNLFNDNLKYGFDHSLYFSRLMKIYTLCPDIYWILRYGSLFFHGNQIANNYSVDVDEIFRVRGPEHQQLLMEVRNGYGLYLKNHGLSKKEAVLES